MKTASLSLCLAAACATAQSPLAGDLQRAASRYEPAATPAPGEVDRFVATAGEFFRNGRVDDAVRSLDRAASVAYRSGATGRAFELSLTAAEALRLHGEPIAAATRFRDAALRNPQDPRAATAHHTACTSMAAALDGKSPAELDDFDRLLGQHLATWPDSPTAEAVRWLRVEQLARRREGEALLAAAATIRPESPHREAALDLIVEAHGELLRERASAERLLAAQRDLIPMIVVDRSGWPKEWSPRQRAAALVLARGSIDGEPAGWADGSKLLRVALTGAPAPPPAWRSEAAALLALAELRNAKNDQAVRWASLVHQGSAEESRRLFDTVRRQMAANPPASLVALAKEWLRNSRLLGQTTGSPPTAAVAEALLAAGRSKEARQAYRKLAEQRPNDRAIQVALARLLAASDTPADREEAVDRWRALESRSDANSAEWWEARIARLRGLVARGRRDEAAKLLALTRLLAQPPAAEEQAAELATIAAELTAGR